MPLRIESNNCTVRCDWKILSFWTLTGHWVGNIFSCQKPLHTVFQRYDYFDCIPHAWFQSCSFFHLRSVFCIPLECFRIRANDHRNCSHSMLLCMFSILQIPSGFVILSCGEVSLSSRHLLADEVLRLEKGLWTFLPVLLRVELPFLLTC